jgi:hypothetical protein
VSSDSLDYLSVVLASAHIQLFRRHGEATLGFVRSRLLRPVILVGSGEFGSQKRRSLTKANQ